MKGMEAVAASHALDVEQESAPAPATPPKSTLLKRASRTPRSARQDWALPAATAEPQRATAPVRFKPKRTREIVTLAPADVEMLRELHERCESVGMRLRKTRLLSAGLHLLASMPIGKFLSLVGPLETPVNAQKIKKRKRPAPA